MRASCGFVPRSCKPNSVPPHLPGRKMRGDGHLSSPSITLGVKRVHPARSGISLAPGRCFPHPAGRPAELWALTPLFSPFTSSTLGTFRVPVVMIGSMVSVALSRSPPKFYTRELSRRSIASRRIAVQPIQYLRCKIWAGMVAVSHYLLPPTEAGGVFGLSSSRKSGTRPSGTGNGVSVAW